MEGCADMSLEKPGGQCTSITSVLGEEEVVGASWGCAGLPVQLN